MTDGEEACEVVWHSTAYLQTPYRNTSAEHQDQLYILLLGMYFSILVPYEYCRQRTFFMELQDVMGK